VPTLRETIESRHFLRSLAEARRRYSGALYPDNETIDCHPLPPTGSRRRRPAERKLSWMPLDLRPRGPRSPAQEPTE